MTLKEIKQHQAKDERPPMITTGGWHGMPNNFKWVPEVRQARRSPEEVQQILEGIKDLVRQGAAFWWQGDTIKAQLGDFSGSFDTSTHGAWYAFALMEAAWPNLVDYPEAYLAERYLAEILEWRRQGHKFRLVPVPRSRFFALEIRRIYIPVTSFPTPEIEWQTVGQFAPGPNLAKLRTFLEAIKII